MRTVFIDRDGVVNESPEPGKYVTSPEEFRLLPGSAEAIRTLNEASVRVIIVTNQRGIALGLMSEEQLQEIHDYLAEELRAEGAYVDGIYYCPHAEGNCECRKPGVGMFMQAQEAFPDLAFDEAWVVGDSDRDMDAGRRLGARLIRIGPGARTDEHACASLREAVDHILGAVHAPDHSR